MSLCVKAYPHTGVDGAPHENRLRLGTDLVNRQFPCPCDPNISSKQAAHMQASQRIRSLTVSGDDGWGLFHRAREMMAEGINVLELTIGEHDIKTDPRILDEMHRSALDGATGYAVVPGLPELRQAIADRVTAQTGVPTTPDNVMVTPGGQAALFMTHHATCDEGDRGLYIDPYYATYPGTIRSVGAVDVAVPARAEDAFQPNRAALQAAAPGAKSLLINSPNNPTGVVYTADTMNMIADVTKENDLWLISDEVYDTQVWDGAHLSPRTLPGMLERTLVIGSLSKSHAMTGSRLGWIVGPEEMIEHAIHLATHTTFGVPAFVQYAGIYGLGLGPEFEGKIGAPFRRRLGLAEDMVAKQQVVHLIPAKGAMYAMLDIRATGHTGTSFAEALLAEEFIAVMPGESFGRAAAGHLRVALTLPDPEFVDAFSRLLAFAGRQAA
jgi:arginine:pyruvate transaminase